MSDSEFHSCARWPGWRQNETRRDSVRGVMKPPAAAAWLQLVLNILIIN